MTPTCGGASNWSPARDEDASIYGTVEQVGFMVRAEDAWTLGYST